MFSPTTGRVASTTRLDFSVSMRLPLGRSPGNAHRLAAEPLLSSRSAHGGRSTRTSGRPCQDSARWAAARSSRASAATAGSGPGGPERPAVGARVQPGADLRTRGGGVLHELPEAAVVHGRTPVARATISVV